jgi:hypothetical protein
MLHFLILDTIANIPDLGEHMDRLVFKCQVTSGSGDDRKLVFPTHKDIPKLPEDWPDKMVPGSLNALTMNTPSGMRSLGDGDDLQKLDNGKFSPAIVMPREAIINNNLGPCFNTPNGGVAQAWRARISVSATGKTVDVWAVRRISSGYRRVIELMSDKNLRQHLRLIDGDKLEVTLYAGDVRPEPTPQPPSRKPSICFLGFEICKF